MIESGKQSNFILNERMGDGVSEIDRKVWLHRVCICAGVYMHKAFLTRRVIWIMDQGSLASLGFAEMELIAFRSSFCYKEDLCISDNGD